jgi:hypothetical protein
VPDLLSQMLEQAGPSQGPPPATSLVPPSAPDPEVLGGAGLGDRFRESLLSALSTVSTQIPGARAAGMALPAIASRLGQTEVLGAGRPDLGTLATAEAREGTIFGPVLSRGLGLEDEAQAAISKVRADELLGQITGREKSLGEMVTRAGVGLGTMAGVDFPTFFIPGGAAVKSLDLAGKLGRIMGPRGVRVAANVLGDAGLFGAAGLTREAVRQATGDHALDPMAVLLSGAREAALGAGFGGARSIPGAGPLGAASRLAGEFAVFGAGGPALSGRLPTQEDLVHAGAMVLGFRALNRVLEGGGPSVSKAKPEAPPMPTAAPKLEPPQQAFVESMNRALDTLFSRESGMVDEASSAQLDRARGMAREDLLAQIQRDPKMIERFGPEATQLVRSEMLRSGVVRPPDVSFDAVAQGEAPAPPVSGDAAAIGTPPAPKPAVSAIAPDVTSDFVAAPAGAPVRARRGVSTGGAPVGMRVDVPAGTTPAFEHGPSDYAGRTAAFRDEMLEKHSLELERQRRSTMTRAQVAELAGRLRLTPKDVDGMLGRQGMMLPVEFQEALVQRMHEGERSLGELRGLEAVARAQGDVARSRELEAQIETTADQVGKLWLTTMAASSEAGRALGARRGKVSPSKMQAAMKAVLDERRLPPEEAQRLVTRIVREGESPEALRKIVREAYVPDVWDKVFEARVMFLLSSPATLMRNTIGNGMAAVSRFLETGAGVGGDMLFGRLAGEGDRRFLREISSDAFGLWTGLKEASHAALQALKDESVAMQGRLREADPRPAIKPDAPGTGLSRFPTLNAAQGPVGTVLRLPGRALAATDIYFATLSRYGEAYKLAARRVLNDSPELVGVDRAEAIQRLAEEALAVPSQRVRELYRDLDAAGASRAEKIALAASRQSEKFSFREELTGVLKTVDSIRFKRDATGRYLPGAKIARLIAPFLPTPLNIARFVGQRTPFVSLVAPSNRAFFRMLEGKGVDRADAVDAWARMAVGGALFTPLLLAASEGLITGAGPADKDARTLWERFKQPWSFYVPALDRYVSYRGLSPISEIMATAALTAERFTESDRVPTAEEAGRILLASTATLLDQPFLTGAADLFDALRDVASGEKRAGGPSLGGLVTNQVAGAVVPRGVAFAARTMDPDRRAFAETIGERIRQDLPGTRGGTVPFRDALGRKVSHPTSTDQLVSAWLQVREPTKDPVDRLLWRASEMPDRSIVNFPSRRQLGRRLDAETYDALLQAKGERLVPLLRRMSESPRVELLLKTPEGRREIAKLIQNTESDETARAVVKTVYPAELKALGLEANRTNLARMLVLMSVPGVKDLYADERTTDEERAQFLMTGKFPPGAAALTPAEAPGAVAP